MANLFGATTPATATQADFSNVSLGTKFQSAAAGDITGIRLYVGNGAPTVGAIYSIGGVQLASVSLTGLSTGYNVVNLASPLAIVASTLYVTVIYWPGGEYPVTNNFFNSDLVNGDLTAPGSPTANGVYNYGTGIAFPTSSYQQSNYFSDIEFTAGGVDAGSLSSPHRVRHQSMMAR